MSDTKSSADASLRDRLVEGGRRGGAVSGARRREKHRRYLAGEMGMVERRDYERLLQQAREGGKLGGWPKHKANRHLLDDNVDGDAAEGK